jgi:hypothetical protein
MDEAERKRLHDEKMEKSAKPSVQGFLLVSAFYLFVAFAIFLIIGFLTDGYGTGDDGNVPGKDCYNYQKANGDWANSCDQ